MFRPQGSQKYPWFSQAFERFQKWGYRGPVKRRKLTIVCIKQPKPVIIAFSRIRWGSGAHLTLVSLNLIWEKISKGAKIAWLKWFGPSVILTGGPLSHKETLIERIYLIISLGNFLARTVERMCVKWKILVSFAWNKSVIGKIANSGMEAFSITPSTVVKTISLLVSIFLFYIFSKELIDPSISTNLWLKLFQSNLQRVRLSWFWCMER